MDINKLTLEEKVVFNAYMDYFKAYASRNWNNVLNTMHSSISVIGTGVDEVCIDKEAVKKFYLREFEQVPEFKDFKIYDLHINIILENTAIIVITLDMEFIVEEQTVVIPLNRTTAVMIKTDKGWKLAHGHWSQGSLNQEIGSSVPNSYLIEQNKLLEQTVKFRTLQIEKHNKELEKINNTKNRLFSIISHDLRSPFNSFMGLSEMMLLNFEKNYPKKEYFQKRLEIIHQQARSLYTLADNILNWAKTQINEVNVEIKNCSVKSLINEQIDGLRYLLNDKKIVIDKQQIKDIQFYTDPDIINIITRNILTNAIKYSTERGKICIGSELIDSQLVITVKDFGIGMDSNTIKTIMQTGSYVTSLPGTNNEKGTGVGLKLCIEALRTVNGNLSIESEREKGTIVKIKIPEYLSI